MDPDRCEDPIVCFRHTNRGFQIRRPFTGSNREHVLQARIDGPLNYGFSIG
jgi:hypothetical protein